MSVLTVDNSLPGRAKKAWFGGLRRMTLLGAIDLGDRILIAGDGRIVLSGASGVAPLSLPTTKVFRLPQQASIAWGFAGDTDIGGAFKTWLEQQGPWASWDALLGAANMQAATFNGQCRRIAQLAGAQRETIEVLLGGYIGGEDRIAIVHDDGGVVTSQWNPIFLGSGMPCAMVAWEAVSRVLPADVLVSEDTFRHVMEATVDRIPALGPPVTILSTAP